MQEQRAFATTLELPGRKTMVAGGARGQLLAQVATLTTEVYSPLTDTFTYGPPMVAPTVKPRFPPTVTPLTPTVATTAKPQSRKQ